MAINHALFLSWMAVIGERVGKEISAPVLNTYRAAFDRIGLSDAEFLAAASGIFEHWTGFGLPTVDEFVKYARPVPSMRSEALEALRRVQAAIVKGEAAPLDDPRTLAAWRAIGGASPIRSASDSEWPHLERRWAQAFCDYGELTERERTASERIARAELALNGGNGGLRPIAEVVPRALEAGS